MSVYLPRNCRLELSGYLAFQDTRSGVIRTYPSFTFRWLGIRLSCKL